MQWESYDEVPRGARAVPLYGKGGITGYTLVDEADYEWAMQYRWHLHSTGRAVRGQYDPSIKRNHILRMHREMMGLERGDKREVDHINRVPLDNRRSNLRVCLHAENQQNNGLAITNKSGFRGVSWDPVRKKWKAQVSDKGRNRFIGRYKHKRDAAQAVAAWRREHMPFSEEAA